MIGFGDHILNSMGTMRYTKCLCILRYRRMQCKSDSKKSMRIIQLRAKLKSSKFKTTIVRSNFRFVEHLVARFANRVCIGPLYIPNRRDARKCSEALAWSKKEKTPTRVLRRSFSVTAASLTGRFGSTIALQSCIITFLVWSRVSKLIKKSLFGDFCRISQTVKRP